MTGETDRRLADEAVLVARDLLVTSEADLTRSERRRRGRLGRLIEDPHGREMLFELTDEVLRFTDPERAAKRFADIVEAHPTTALGPIDRVLMKAGALLAPRLPKIVMPLVTRRIAAETRGVVLPADDPAFADHVARRAAEDVGLNINVLGEAILSDAEADARLRMVLARIERSDVDYVSVKISAVVAHLDTYAFDHSVDAICERLRTLYRAARGAHPPVFVNLDMEEYRDLEMTLAGFMRVLDEDEFADLDAGVVLQAYLPDSHDALEELGAWAVARHERAGGHVKVRLVKGANLAMESVEAELHGWVPAPYPTKADVDASFKAMLDSALRPEWADAIRVGVASHNLFDIAWPIVVGRDRGALDRIDIEMLEGMAPAQARAVHARTGELLMYAPVVTRADFAASLAYLTRRLDENTQEDNFLRALFHLQLDSPAWDEQERRFRESVDARHTVARTRRRHPVPLPAAGFANQPDTDVTDADVRFAAYTAITPTTTYGHVTDTAVVNAVVDRAAAAITTWSTLTGAERRAAISAAADEMERCRFETIKVMANETGKVFAEADPEVSEAVDFARYYSGPGIDLFSELAADGVGVSGRGVVAVIGPWNFPYAIPAGGVFAALSAGNAVILKPAPEAEKVAAVLVDQLHRAGIPADLVQLVTCEDGPIGRHLVTHPGVDTVILTGSLATARMFLGWEPDLRLFAETSGKNALVITAAADLDLAIHDLVRSAFGHAGQKCSAASLAIVEAPVYDDPAFLPRLRHVVESWRVGWPSNPASMIGPLINPPSGPLERAFTTLDPGEHWLVEPRSLDDSGRLWRPGVRTGVQPGSWFHLTECFGPVLGVMRAENLDEAIEIQNATSYGLTGGIHSLDGGEVEHWLDKVEIGNAYVNRHITGAVVQRQPFGGWKGSQVGPGTKAGGPSYVLQLARLSDPSGATADTVRASYEQSWRWFSTPHDPSGLAAESNVLRHLPVRRVVTTIDDPALLDRLRLAAATTGVELVTTTPEALLATVRDDDRVRLPADADRAVLQALTERGIWFDTAPPSAHGRIELVKWVREQAIAHTMHRHGRLRNE